MVCRTPNPKEFDMDWYGKYSYKEYMERFTKNKIIDSF